MSRGGYLPDKHKEYIQILSLDINTFELSDLLTTNEAIRGLTSSIKLGDNLFLGSWVDKAMAVCFFSNWWHVNK